MGAKWQLQDAKNRLSEVVRKAQVEGPQTITLRGSDAVVVLAANEYLRLTQPQEGRLTDFFRNSPLSGVELDIGRPTDTGRDISLS